MSLACSQRRSTTEAHAGELFCQRHATPLVKKSTVSTPSLGNYFRSLLLLLDCEGLCEKT